jgi:hypothetical protein
MWHWRSSERREVDVSAGHRADRNSLAFVSWKDRKAMLPAIKAI